MKKHNPPSGLTRLVLLIALFFSCLTVLAQVERKPVSGVISDGHDKPVQMATISNKTAAAEGRSITAVSDREGKFTIVAAKGDIITFAAIGFKKTEAVVNNVDAEFKVSLTEAEGLTEVLVTAWAPSPRSTWVGAKVGYNFDGITEDNSFIGAAKISINPLKSRFSDSKSCPYISVIGNFADFISNSNRDSVKVKISSLTQSVQGLSIGLGSTWELPFDLGDNRDNRIYLRPYITSNYRLNTFTKVGADSSTVNLSQWRSTIGIEFEGLTFSNGGALNISFEAAVSTFGASRYAKVFGERKSSITSLEGTLILPISRQIGFFVNGTFARNTRPIFLTGVIVKSN